MEIKQIKRNFSVDVIEKFVDDDDPEFAYGTTLFLSTRPNTHGLNISEEVLRKCADTIKGKWLVCKVNPYTKDGEAHMMKVYAERYQKIKTFVLNMIIMATF